MYDIEEQCSLIEQQLFESSNLKLPPNATEQEKEEYFLKLRKEIVEKTIFVD